MTEKFQTTVCIYANNPPDALVAQALYRAANHAAFIRMAGRFRADDLEVCTAIAFLGVKDEDRRHIKAVYGSLNPPVLEVRLPKGALAALGQEEPAAPASPAARPPAAPGVAPTPGAASLTFSNTSAQTIAQAARGEAAASSQSAAADTGPLELANDGTVIQPDTAPLDIEEAAAHRAAHIPEFAHATSEPLDLEDGPPPSEFMSVPESGAISADALKGMKDADLKTYLEGVTGKKFRGRPPSRAKMEQMFLRHERGEPITDADVAEAGAGEGAADPGAEA